MTTPTQPPDHCPACGCTEIEFFTEGDELIFKCNCTYYCSTNKLWYREKSNEHQCTRSFSAAIALRAERDAALARAAELQDAISCELPILFMLMPSVHGRLRAALASGAESEMTK